MATEGETSEHISAEKIEVKESTCNQVETVTDKSFFEELEKVEDRHNLPPETDNSTKVADLAVAPDAMVDPDIEGKLSISGGQKLLESASLVKVSSEETRELSKQSTCSQLDTVTDKTSLEELAKVEDTEAAELAVIQDAMVDPDTEGKFSIYGSEKLLESASLVKVSSEETHELSKDGGENVKPVHTKIEVLENDSQMPKDQADKMLKATCGVIEVEKISTCGEKVSTETSLENANTQDNGLARSSELSTENMKDEDYMGEKPAVDLDLQEGKTADRDSEFQEEKEHKYEELSDVIQTSIGIVSHQLVQFPVTESNEETIEVSCASQNIEEEKTGTSPQNGETEGKKLSEDSDAESAKEALQKIHENLGQDQEDASPTPDVIKQILQTDIGIVGEPKNMEQGIDNKTEEEAYSKDEGINNNLDIHITPIKNKAKQYSSQEEEFEATEQEIPSNFADLPVYLEVVNQEDEIRNDNNENAKDSLDTLMVTTKVEEDAYSKEDAIDNNSNVHIMPIKYEAKQSSSQEEEDTEKELTSNFTDPPIRLETVKQEDETGNDKIETAKDSLDNLMVAPTKKMEEVCSKDEGIENKLDVYIMTIKQEDKQSSSPEKEFENKEKEITSKFADLPICMETVSQENESGNDKYENAKDSMDNLMTMTKEMEEEAYSKDKEIDNNLDVHIMPIKHEAKHPSSQEEGLVDKEQEITSIFEEQRICPESVNQEDETGNDKNENANDSLGTSMVTTSLKVQTKEEVILEIDDTSHQFDPSLHKTGIDETSSLGAKAEESGPPPFTSCHSLDETSLETTDPSKKLNNDNIMEPQILDDNIIKHERVESRDEEISDQKLPEEQSEVERLKRPMVVAYEGLEASASGKAERDTYVKEREGDESNGSDENVMNHVERNQNLASGNSGDISESGVAEEHEKVTDNKQVGENLEEENTVESIESKSTGTTLINQAKTTEEATTSGCTQACNKDSEKIREIEELDSDNKLENIVSKEFREDCITEEGITDPYLHKGEDRITHEDGDVKDQNIVSLGFETSIDSFQIYKQDDYNFEEKTSETEYENQTCKIQDADDTASGISSEEVNEKPKMNDEGKHAQKYPEDDCIVTDLTTMSIGHVQEEDANKTVQEVNEELETETADKYSENQKAQEAGAMEVNFTVPKADENEMEEPKGGAFEVLEIADAEKDIGEQIVEETAAMGVAITTIGEEESVNESYQENEAHKTNKSAVEAVFTENQIKEDLSVAVLSTGYIEKAVEMISKECEGSEVIEISATEKDTAEPIRELASSVSVGDETTIKNSQEDRQDKKKHHLEAKEPDLIPTELNFEASDSTHGQENLLKDEKQYTNSDAVDSKETTEELLQKESSEDISDTSILIAMVHKEEIKEGVIDQEENTTHELRTTPNTKITEKSSSNEIEPECEESKGTETSAAEKETAEPIMELASTESVGDETTISNSQEDGQDKKKQNLESGESDLIPMELNFEASDSTHGQENLLNDEKQSDVVDSMETTEELLQKESSEEINDTSILVPMVHKGETEEEIIEQEENIIHEQTASNTKTTENSNSNEIEPECEGFEGIETSAVEKDTAEPIMELASSVSIGNETTISNSQEDVQDKKRQNLEDRESDLIPMELKFEASDSTHEEEKLLNDEKQYMNQDVVDSKETSEELLQKESNEEISDTSILVPMVHKEEIREGIIEQEENTIHDLRSASNTKITENSSSNEIEPEYEGSKGTETSAAEKETTKLIMELVSTESIGDETTISNSQEDGQNKKKQNLESRESDLIPMELNFEASDSTHGQETLLNDEKQSDVVDSIETTEELLQKESSVEISDTSILVPMVHKGETEEGIIEQEENTIHEQTSSNTKTTENSNSNEIEPECEGYKGIETSAVEKDTAKPIMELASSVSVGDETTINNSQEDVQDKKRQNLEDGESDLIPMEVKFEASDSTHGQEKLLNDEKQYMNQDVVDSKETSEKLLQKESNEEISDTSILVPMVHKEEIREGITEQEENTIHDLRSASNTKIIENSSSNEIEPEYEGSKGTETSAAEKETAEPIMELASTESAGDETTNSNSQENGQDKKKQNIESRESDLIPMELNFEASDSTHGQENLLMDEKQSDVDSKETTEELLQKESSEEISDTSILVPMVHKGETEEGIIEQEENTIHEQTSSNTKITENSNSNEIEPECEGYEEIETSTVEKYTAEPIMELASSVSVGDETTISNSQEDIHDKKRQNLEDGESDLIPMELKFEASDSTHGQEKLLNNEKQYMNQDVDYNETAEKLLQKESNEEISDTSILVPMVHKEEIREGIIEQEENTLHDLRSASNTKITENSSSNEIEPEYEGSKGTETSAAEKETAEPIMELASTESVGDETTISNFQEDGQDKKKQNLESREYDLIPMELNFEASDSTHGQENLLMDEKQSDVDSMETTEELLQKECSEEINDTSILVPMVHKGETEVGIIEQEENTIHEQTASNTKTTENSNSNEIEPECEGYEEIETSAVEKDTAEPIMELASSVSVGNETTISNSQEGVHDKKRQNLEDRESDLIPMELKFESSDSTHGQEKLLNDEKQYMNQDAIDSKETSEELLQKESNVEISDTSILVPMVHKEEIREGIIEQEENTIHDLRSAFNTKITENSSSNEIEPKYEGFEGIEISVVEKDTAGPIMELASSVSVGDETTIRNSQEDGQDQKKQNLEARESDSIPMELNCEVSDSTHGQEKLLNDEKLYISPDVVDSMETTEDELLQKESSEEIGDTSILVPIEHKKEIKKGIMEQEENTIHELRTAANTKLTENSSSNETEPECEKSIHMPDILETAASGTYVENNSCEKEQAPMGNLNESSNEERDGIDTKVRDDIGENGTQSEEVVAFSNPSGEESVQGVGGEVSNVEREENFQANGAHLKEEDYITEAFKVSMSTETTISEQEKNLDGATSSKPIQTSEIECVKVGQTHESDSMEAVENNDDKENMEGATSNKEKTSNEIECRDIKGRNIEEDGHIDDQNIFLLRRETSLHRCHEDEEQKKIDEREPDEKDEDQILDVEDTSIHNEEVCDEPTTGDVGEDRENREEHCSVEDIVIASIREDTVEESPDREIKEANKPDDEVCEVLEKSCTDDHIEKQNIHEDGALAEHFKVPVVGETVTGNSQTDEKVAQDNEAEIFRRLETTTGGKDTENSAIEDLSLTKHVTASMEERVKESSHDVVHERLEMSENEAFEEQISQDDTFQQRYTLPLGEETTEEGSHGDELSEEPNDVTSKQLNSLLLVLETTEESSHGDELYEELNPTGAREDTGNQIMIDGMEKGANMVSVGEQKAEENCQEDQNNATFQGEVKESDLGSPDGTTDSTKEMDPVTLQDGEDTAKNFNSFNAMDVPSEDITQKESSDHPSHAFPLSEASEEQITGIQEKKYNSSHEQETDPIAMFTEEISLSETEPEVRKLEEASHLVSEDMIPAPTKESISIEEVKPEGTPNLDETVSKETLLTHDSRANDATMCEMPEGVSILVLQSVIPDIETTTSEMITASKSIPDVISEKNSQGPPALVSNNHDFEPEDEASLQDEIRDENLETPLVEQTREMNLQMEESRKFEEDMDMFSQDIGKENATPDVEPENLSSEMKDAILESGKPIEVAECNNTGKSETSEPPGLEHNKSEVKDQCDVFSNEHEAIGAYVNIKKHSLQEEDPTKKENQDRNTIDGIIVDNTPVEVNAKDDNHEIESSNILQQEDGIIVDNVLVEEDPTKEEDQSLDRSTRDCIIMDNTPDEVKAKDDSHETESSNILQQEDPIKECLINEDMLVEKHNLLQEDLIQKEDQSLDGSRKDCTIIEDMLVAIKAKDDSHQNESSNTTRTENITQTLEVIDLGEKVEYASELRDQDDRHKTLPKTEKTEWEKAREIVVDQYTVSFENRIDGERSQKKENEKNNLEVGHKLDYDNQNDETNGAIDVGEAIKNKTEVRGKTIAEEPVEGEKDAKYPYKEVCGGLDTAYTDEHIEKQQIIPKDDTVMEHVSRNTGEQTIVDASKNGDMVEHEAEVSRDLEVSTDTERHILQENDVSMDQSPTYVREAAVQVCSQEGEEAKNPQKVYPELETTSRTEDIEKEIMEEKEEDVEVYNTVSIEQEIVREIFQEDEEVEQKIGEVFDGINTVSIRNDTEEHVMGDDVKESSQEEELNEELETVGARENAENYTVEDRAGTEICSVSISEQTTEESSQENKEKEIKQEGEVKESILKSIEGATDSTEEIDLLILKKGKDQNMSSSAFNPTEAPSEQIILKDKTEVSHVSSISPVSQEQIKEYSEKNENARNNLEITSIANLNEEMNLYESETDGGKPVDDPDLSSEERIPAPTNASSIDSRSQDIEHVKFEETFNLDENVTNEVIFTEDSGPNQGKQEMDEMHVEASFAIPPQSVDQIQNTEITTATENSSFTPSSDDKSKEKSQELSILANIYEFNSTKANEEIKKETAMKDQFRDKDLETALVAQTLQMEEPREPEENSEIGYEDIGVESPIPQLDPERLSSESNETILEREKVIELTEFSENITLETPELGLEKNSADCKDQFDTLSNELEAVQAYGHMERDIPQQQDSNNEDGQSFTGSRKEIINMEETLVENEAKDHSHETDHFNTISNQTLAQTLEAFDLGKKLENVSDTRILEQNQQTLPETKETELEKEKEMVKDQDVVSVEDQINDQQFEEEETEGKNLEAGPKSDADYQDAEANYANSLLEKIPHSVRKNDESEAIEEEIMEGEANDKDVEVTTVNRSVQEVKESYISGEQNSEARDSEENTDMENWSYFERLIKKANSYPDEEASGEKIQNKESGDMTYSESAPVIIAKNEEKILETKHKAELDTESTAVCSEEKILKTSETIETDKNFDLEITSNLVSELPTVQNENKNQENRVVENNKAEDTEMVDLGKDEPLKNSERSIKQDQENDEAVNLKIETADFENSEKNTDELPNLATTQSLAELMFSGFGGECEEDSNHESDRAMESMYETQIHETLIAAKESEYNEYEGITKNHDTSFITEDSVGKSFQEDKDGNENENQVEADTKFDGRAKQNENDTNENETDNIEVSMPHENECATDNIQSLGKEAIKEPDLLDSVAIKIQESQGENGEGDKIKEESTSMGSEEQIHEKQAKEAQRLPEDFDNISGSKEIVKESTGGDELLEYVYKERPQGDEMDEYQIKIQTIKLEPEVANQELDSGGKTNENTEKESVNEEVSQSSESAAASQNILEQINEEKKSSYGIYLMPIDKEKTETTHQDDEMDRKTVKNEASKVHIECQDELSDRDHTIENEEAKSSEAVETYIETTDPNAKRKTATSGDGGEDIQSNATPPRHTQFPGVPAEALKKLDEQSDLVPEELIHDTIKENAGRRNETDDANALEDILEMEKPSESASNLTSTTEKLHGEEVSNVHHDASSLMEASKMLMQMKEGNSAEVEEMQSIALAKETTEVNLTPEVRGENIPDETPLEEISDSDLKKLDELNIQERICARNEETLQTPEKNTPQETGTHEETSYLTAKKHTHGEAGSIENTEAETSVRTTDIPPTSMIITEKSLHCDEGENQKRGEALLTESKLKEVESGGGKSITDLGEEKIDELKLSESTDVSPSDLLQRSMKDTEQMVGHSDKANLSGNKELENKEAPTSQVEEEAEAEEEKDQEGEADEHKNVDSGSDAPIMVEASQDIDVKPTHKKSHNILSGVGSKVKQSISKVKKAITGKSSHHKQQSPK